MGTDEEEWFQGRLRNALISEMPRLRSIFKTPAYREEREWRIVQFVPRESSQYAIIFRSNRGRLVPYLELAFGQGEQLPISEVTVGPTLDPVSSSRTTTLLLRKTGHGNANVRVSSVPFRL